MSDLSDNEDVDNDAIECYAWESMCNQFVITDGINIKTNYYYKNPSSQSLTKTQSVVLENDSKHFY